MGKVNRLRNRLEPFAALFSALGNAPTPDPARRVGTTPPPYTKHVHIYGNRRADFPPFSYLL